MNAAGMYLSQPAMQTMPSKEVAAGDEFDGVGDDFTGDERGLHALGAHGDAVGDGDGVELHGGSASFADALLYGGGYIAEMKVAGADLGPGVGYANDWLVQVFFGETYSAQVGAGGGAVGAFGEGDRVFFWIDFVAHYLHSFHLLPVARGRLGMIPVIAV